MKCPYCNAGLDDGSIFCMNCGAKVNSDSEVRPLDVVSGASEGGQAQGLTDKEENMPPRNPYGGFNRNQFGNRDGGFGQNSYNGFGQNSYSGFGQNSYNGFGQNSYNGFGQNSYNGFGQNSYNGFGQNSYNGFGQNSYNGFGQSYENPSDGNVKQPPFGSPSNNNMGQPPIGSQNPGNMGQPPIGNQSPSNIGQPPIGNQNGNAYMNSRLSQQNPYPNQNPYHPSGQYPQNFTQNPNQTLITTANSRATGSIVCGSIGVLGISTIILPLLLGIFAIVLGVSARKTLLQYRQPTGAATGGIILGIISVSAMVILMGLFVLVIISLSSWNYQLVLQIF